MQIQMCMPRIVSYKRHRFLLPFLKASTIGYCTNKRFPVLCKNCAICYNSRRNIRISGSIIITRYNLLSMRALLSLSPVQDQYLWMNQGKQSIYAGVKTLQKRERLSRMDRNKKSFKTVLRQRGSQCPCFLNAPDSTSPSLVPISLKYCVPARENRRDLIPILLKPEREREFVFVPGYNCVSSFSLVVVVVEDGDYGAESAVLMLAISLSLPACPCGNGKRISNSAAAMSHLQGQTCA